MKDNKSSITSLGRIPLLSGCLVFCLAVTGCGNDDGPALQPINRNCRLPSQIPSSKSDIKATSQAATIGNSPTTKVVSSTPRASCAVPMRKPMAPTNTPAVWPFLRQPCKSQIQAAKKRSFSSMLWDTSNTCRSIKTNTTSNTSTAVS